MNTKRRGAALERRAIAILERCGYKCQKAGPNYSYSPRKGAYSTGTDFFGAFDFVAKKKGCRTLWVQVTTKNVSISSKVSKFKGVSNRFDRRFDDVQVWRWRTPKPTKTGDYQVVRWDDDFDHRSSIYIRSDADTLPWEEPPC